MSKIGFFWGLGVANLIFTAVGLLAMATLVGFPLFMGAAALRVPQEDVARLLAYSSPIWAPVGAGFGLFTAGSLVRGVRRGAESKESEKGEEGSFTLLIVACVAALASIPLGAYLLFWR